MTSTTLPASSVTFLQTNVTADLKATVQIHATRGYLVKCFATDEVRQRRKRLPSFIIRTFRCTNKRIRDQNRFGDGMNDQN